MPIPFITAYILSLSRSASSKRLSATIPIPSPISIPLESMSNGRMVSSGVKAGVLLNDRYIKGELSVSIPPAIMISLRYSSRSLMAIFIAVSELAQAASSTQLVPPRFSRFATRPAITLPSIPGNEFSSQPMYAFLIFSTISSESSSEIPELVKTRFHMGY